MKWNWGTKIVLSFVLFGAFILYMVAQAFRMDFDLVSDNYYQDELAFQDRIDEKVNLRNSGNEVAINQNGEKVVFEFPETFKGAEGMIYFYHPSRKLFDRTYSLSLDEKNQQKIDQQELVKGRYKVKVSWKVDGLSYFQEKELYLQ
ncbi:MAG: FixH family protein [Bacteroidota bacterium]